MSEMSRVTADVHGRNSAKRVSQITYSSGETAQLYAHFFLQH